MTNNASIPAPPPDLDREWSAWSYVKTLRAARKYWKTGTAIALAIVVAMAFRTLGATKFYVSSGTVMFDPSPPRPLGKGVETVVELGPGSYFDNREFYSTQTKIIQSMRVAEAAVTRLGLDHDPSFSGGPGAKPSQQDTEIAASVLLGGLSVELVKDSAMAIIRYEDPDPARAQRILSAVLDVYVEQNLEYAVSSTGSAVDWLRTQVDRLKQDLESSELALHEYKQQKNILSVAFDDQSNILRNQIKQLSDSLTALRVKREEVAARRAQLQKVQADPWVLPASELLASPVLGEFRRQHTEAVRERDALLGAGKGQAHPDVQAAQARVSAARQALVSEIYNISGAVDRDLAGLDTQIGSVSGLLDEGKKQALDLNLLEIEYNRLRRAKENNEKLFDMLLERMKESDLARMLRVNNVRVIDRPRLPTTPARPNVPRSLALGTFVGLLLGIAAAAGRAVLDRTIKAPEDLTRDLGIPLLGTIPEIVGNRPPYIRRFGRKRPIAPTVPPPPPLVVSLLPSSGAAEAARAIRTNLIFQAPDRPYRTLLVTSPSSSEGKTTVACCIAIAMANAGQKVLLMDCDLRRPALHRIFGKRDDVGTTTMLVDVGAPELLDVTTNIENLSVLGAGPIPPNPSELFHSAKFQALLESLKRRYDRVIIDSPPVLPVTDAAVLSTVTDGTVLVARANRTRKELLARALRALSDVGAKLAGGVLNSASPAHHHGYVYEYYESSAPAQAGKGASPDETTVPPQSH